MRARFWTWENGGWIKITLAPGQSVSWSKYSTDEEGWSRESATWQHEGTHVRLSWHFEGKDCDGVITRGGETICPLSRLAAASPYDDGTDRWKPEGRPDWQEPKEWQRDAQAELANY